MERSECCTGTTKRFADVEFEAISLEFAITAQVMNLDIGGADSYIYDGASTLSLALYLLAVI